MNTYAITMYTTHKDQISECVEARNKKAAINIAINMRAKFRAEFGERIVGFPRIVRKYKTAVYVS